MSVWLQHGRGEELGLLSACSVCFCDKGFHYSALICTLRLSQVLHASFCGVLNLRLKDLRLRYTRLMIVTSVSQVKHLYDDS